MFRKRAVIGWIALVVVFILTLAVLEAFADDVSVDDPFPRFGKAAASTVPPDVTIAGPATAAPGDFVYFDVAVANADTLQGLYSVLEFDENYFAYVDVIRSPMMPAEHWYGILEQVTTGWCPDATNLISVSQSNGFTGPVVVGGCTTQESMDQWRPWINTGPFVFATVKLLAIADGVTEVGFAPECSRVYTNLGEWVPQLPCSGTPIFDSTFDVVNRLDTTHGPAAEIEIRTTSSIPIGVESVAWTRVKEMYR